jgi:hypothetical protein
LTCHLLHHLPFWFTASHTYCITRAIKSGYSLSLPSTYLLNAKFILSCTFYSLRGFGSIAFSARLKDWYIPVMQGIAPTSKNQNIRAVFITTSKHSRNDSNQESPRRAAQSSSCASAPSERIHSVFRASSRATEQNMANQHYKTKKRQDLRYNE